VAEIGEEILCEDFATGGRPRSVVDAVILNHAVKGEVRSVAVGHDPGCPVTEEDETLASCTCEVLKIAILRVA